VLPGLGTVQGFVLTYADMAAAMPFLDELEGTSFDPPLYHRVMASAYVAGEEQQVWLYIFGDKDRCLSASVTSGSRQVESGMWRPETSEEGLYP
jgi:gamma-glutamylcyclotransferase (GGCT)/AIG2-like uncharacterized protein YtfP